jgi:hypothetical protein
VIGLLFIVGADYLRVRAGPKGESDPSIRIVEGCVEGRVYWRGAAVCLEEVLRAEKTERLAMIRHGFVR